MSLLGVIKKGIGHPSKLPLALRIEILTFLMLIRHGIPDVMLEFPGAIGDELLLTILACELKKRNPELKIWQVSHSAELLYRNPDYEKVFSWNHWPLRFSNLLNSRRCKINGYVTPVIFGEKYIPPSEHIATVMCRKAGIRGQICLKPRIFLTEDEKKSGRFSEDYIVVQYPGKNSYAHMKNNKIWDIKKFHKVLELVASGSLNGKTYYVVQLGGTKDPPLQGVVDLRGKTSLRESAAILWNCQFFFGFEGFLMHLSRSVDCRSVIIYGGFAHSWQTGYICNENINSIIDCAPCWRLNTCDHGRKCMDIIEVDDVLEAIQRVLAKRGSPLETETVNL